MMLLTYLSYGITLVCVGALASIAISLYRIASSLQIISNKSPVQVLSPVAASAPVVAVAEKTEPVLDDEKRIALFTTAAQEFLGEKVRVVKFREAGQENWILNGSQSNKGFTP